MAENIPPTLNALWKNWSINITLSLKSVYIKFAKKVATTAFSWAFLNICFFIIFFCVLQCMVQCEQKMVWD